MTPPGRLAILSIATNKYLDFYKDLIKSYAEKCDRNLNLEFHLFTDQISQAREIKIDYPWLKIFLYEIKPLVWPEASYLDIKYILKRLRKFHQITTCILMLTCFFLMILVLI